MNSLPRNPHYPPRTLARDIDVPRTLWPDDDCPECDYLKAERAGMWMDNGADQETADQEASSQQCAECFDSKKQTEMKD